MLNSALGVTFPISAAPPMNVIEAMLSLTSGWSRSNTPMLVSGPVGMRVTGSGLSRIAAAMNSAAGSSTGSVEGSWSSGPSSPDSPWTYSAITSSRVSGAAAPTATGTSGRPASSSTISAFLVVFSSVVFPATVVTPRMSSSGLATASKSAMASSCPGSQSMMTGLVTDSP